MIYRMGFAASRKAARQLIRHRHVEVNGKSRRHPELSSSRRARKCASARSRARCVPVLAAMDQSSRGAPLSWLAVDRDTFSGRMLERPSRPNIPIAAQEQLVVELYSK